MKRFIVLAGVALALVPALAVAKPKPAAHHTMATKYECVKCHMQYSAADAKKDGYQCTMDGGKLVPVKPSSHKM